MREIKLFSQLYTISGWVKEKIMRHKTQRPQYNEIHRSDLLDMSDSEIVMQIAI